MLYLMKKGFTLTEIMIAISLTTLIILVAASVDITSRKFFEASSKRSRVQDEAKIVMEHMAANIQLGIGDRTNPGTSDGFFISGKTIQIKQDANGDGKFGAGDKTVEYAYQGSPYYKIVYDPNIGAGGDEEDLTDSMITDTTFTAGSDPNFSQVDVTIEAREDPTKNAGLDNPQVTLTSSFVLRAMSTH